MGKSEFLILGSHTPLFYTLQPTVEPLNSAGENGEITAKSGKLFFKMTEMLELWPGTHSSFSN